MSRLLHALTRTCAIFCLGGLLSACVSRPVPPAQSTAPPPPPAADPRARSFSAIVWSTDAPDLESFQAAAARAKAAGATHMVISDNLPHALWEYAASEAPGDPYPAWYDYRPSLLKIYTPGALQKYIPQDYARRVAALIEERCAILRRLGMQAVFQANEPQVLPEAVFRDHPLWRGPRVDQPNRSRAPHFAPCVDQPEVLALYRHAIAAMLARCPAISMFRFVTTDAGSGLCWAAGLYPGANGPAACRDRPMDQRLRGFFDALQSGARDSGATIEIRLAQIDPEEWMTPTFPDPAALARAMPPGIAINNFESPRAAPYASQVGWPNPNVNFFNPVHGIPNPAEVLAGLRTALANPAPRLTLYVPRNCDDLYARVLEQARAHPPLTSAEQANLLQNLAADQVGPDHAEDLVQVWLAIAKANELGTLFKFAYPSTFGGVHQRWLTRPLLPFPEELPPEQTAYYRRFLLQAKNAAQSNDLVDLQAMHLYEGWSGRMWILNVYNRVEPEIRNARTHLAALLEALPHRRAEYQLLDEKLAAFLLLCTNARDAVNYQAVLDYVKARKVPPDENPPLGTKESWDRRMLEQIARAEIDNSAALLELLQKNPALLETAPTPDQEDTTLLSPDLPTQLRQKINLMNAHWQDYNRLTTRPNQ